MKIVSPKVLANVASLQLVTIALLIWQWKKVVETVGVYPTWRDLLEVNMRGIFFDTVTPGAKMGGEVARVYTLKKRLDMSLGDGFLVVGVQKTLSLVSFLILSTLSLMWFYLNTRVQILYMVIFGIGLIFLLGLLVLFISFIIFQNKIQKRISSLPIGKKIKEKIISFFSSYSSSFASLKDNKKNFIGQIALSALIWLIFALKMYILAYSLGIKIGWLTLSAITYLTYMVGMLPMLPGGIGSFEGSMIGLLLLKGIDINTGITLTVLFRFITFWFPFLLSLISIGISEIRSFFTKNCLKKGEKKVGGIL